MNADERHLITDLFDRLRNYGPIEKDHEAENLIISHARNNPDAGYMLVQNILVQEQVMQQQQQQIEDLQAQLAQMQRGGSGQRSGGFLGGAQGNGGMFGGRPSAGAVPSAGRPAVQPQAYNPAPAPSSPWGRTSAAQPPQYQPAPAAPAQGGGFMKSAAAMAAGVAGGMLAANAIQGMMRGNQPGNQPASSDLGNNDPGNYDSGTSAAASSYEQTNSPYTADNNDPGNAQPEQNYMDSGTSWDGGGDVEL